MSLLNAQVQDQVRQALSAIEKPVKIVIFSQGGGALECDFCAETRQLVEEVVALSDQISVEVRDFVADDEMAEVYAIDKIPAIAILRGGDEPKDYGIRLFGIPSGYEFSTLIEDILMVSRGQHNLSDETVKQLASLDQRVHIQVFVTPTCPYCPRAVTLAHRLAMASDLITADMVEATEFPHLSNKYHVHGVPRSVINEVIHIEGAVPEAMLIDQLMTVMDQDEMSRLQKDWNLHLH